MNFISNFPIKFNITSPTFRSNAPSFTPKITGEPYGDGFSTNPIYESDEARLLADVKSNPRIKEIMDEYNLPVKLNIKELENLKRGHLAETRVVAAQIYSSLPGELKSEVNMSDLQQAAMFHDWGKALIPPSVLNKAGEFNDKEYEIMNLHSELGYEMLKNKGLNKNTLEMIRNHHTKGSNDVGTQVLSAADKYCALREERCYKAALSKDEALKILYEDVQNGVIMPEIYNALKRAV